MKKNIISLLKFGTLVILSSLALVISNYYFLGFLFILLCLFTLNRAGKKKFMSRLIPLIAVSFFIILFNLIFAFNDSVTTRMLRGISASLKINTLSMAVFAFTLTASPVEIIGCLFFLPSIIRLSLTITLSLLNILPEEMNLIEIVQKTRGLKQSKFNPLAGLIPVIIPLLHRTMKRADQLSMVIYSRGYEER